MTTSEYSEVLERVGADLMQFVGSIEPSSLRAMEQAIKEACEQVDPRGW